MARGTSRLETDLSQLKIKLGTVRALAIETHTQTVR